jgi:chromosome segregation ATPase
MDENTAREGLEDALHDEPDTSHGETEQSTQATETDTKGQDNKKGPGPVPYQRFKEVNDRLKTYEEALDAKNQELEDRATALSKLTSVLSAKEEAAGYIEKIRELHRSGDPQWAPVLEKLDRRLAGIEEEVDSGDKTEKEGADETRRILKATTAKLEDAIMDQRADLIVAKADSYAALSNGSSRLGSY